MLSILATVDVAAEKESEVRVVKFETEFLVTPHVWGCDGSGVAGVVWRIVDCTGFIWQAQWLCT